jgi:thiol-disulfide isomerase/thioredoxin
MLIVSSTLMVDFQQYLWFAAVLTYDLIMQWWIVIPLFSLRYMKKILFLVCSLICIASGSLAQTHCIVEGKLSGGNGNLVVYPYQEVNSQKEAEKYTVRVSIVNGKFNAKLDGMMVLRNLSFKYNGKQDHYALFTEPGCNITIVEENGAYVVKGSSLHDEYLKLCKELNYGRYEKVGGSHNLSKEDSLFVEDYKVQLLAAIKKYPKSIPLSCLLYKSYWSSDYDTYKRIIDNFDKSIYDSYYLKQFIERRDVARNMDLGQISPDFTLPDEKGGKHTLSSLRGSYVLIDFWASWCGPCRKEIPNVKKVFEAYKDKNLKIISVSTDAMEKSWFVALEKENMPWLQLRDVDSKVSKVCSINFIPYIILLSPEGKILAKELHGELLWKTLEKELK